jgi:hypothetical protein
LRRQRHHRFLRSCAAAPAAARRRSVPVRVLVLGVYMADRVNSVEHLAEAFGSTPDMVVEQRWVALKGEPQSARLRQVTALVAARPEPKFELLNRVLRASDADDFDFVMACDDDIYLPRGFLPAFIAYQEKFDFALAQPARAWHSYFDHAFALRRPWLQARETRFVEMGPLVSLRSDAVRLLTPFDHASEMWGIDLVWAAVIERHRLKMGIVDAVSVDHSLRPQATTYDKRTENAAMTAYLATRPHIPMDRAFTVVKRHGW